MNTMQLVLQLHTPQELQYFSNLAHWTEGGLFILIAFIALLEVMGKLQSKSLSNLWPGILFLSGLFLPVFMFAHHTGSEFKLAWDATFLIPEQRQHFFMAMLLMISGGAELYVRKNLQASSVLRYVFPVSLIIIGALFLYHPQHGMAEDMMRVVTIHKYLGLSIIAAGVFKGLAEFTKLKLLTYAWILFMMISASLLITYREADMSYLAEPEFQEMHMNH
jgi:hypothetical protein